MRIVLPSTEFSSLTHKEQGIIGNQHGPRLPPASSSFTPDVLHSDVHRSESSLDPSTAACGSVSNVRAATSDTHASSSYDQSFASAATNVYSTLRENITPSVGGSISELHQQHDENVSTEVNNNNTDTCPSAPLPQTTRFSYAAAACRPAGGKAALVSTNGDAHTTASPSNTLMSSSVSTTPTVADVEVAQVCVRIVEHMKYSFCKLQKKLTQSQRKQQQKGGGKNKRR
jgi:hypothetical protein